MQERERRVKLTAISDMKTFLAVTILILLALAGWMYVAWHTEMQPVYYDTPRS